MQLEESQLIIGLDFCHEHHWLGAPSKWYLILSHNKKTGPKDDSKLQKWTLLSEKASCIGIDGIVAKTFEAKHLRVNMDADTI